MRSASRQPPGLRAAPTPRSAGSSSCGPLSSAPSLPRPPGKPSRSSNPSTAWRAPPTTTTASAPAITARPTSCTADGRGSRGHRVGSRWEVRSEKPLYTDEWLDIRLADVELPDGRRLEHRLIRTRPGAGVAMIVDGSVLLLWRHRFITGTWGWEVPLGKADPGEDPPAAAAREAEEETGWRPGPLRPLLTIEPTPRVSDPAHPV